MTRISAGYTLVELLLAVALVSALSVASYAAYSRVSMNAKKSRSVQNLRQLVMANHAYAAANDGYFCPSQDRRNRIRWHGGRVSGSAPFDPSKGFLSPYLDSGGALQMCPMFKAQIKGAASFEDNAGGYGYNAQYVGGSNGSPYQGAYNGHIPHPGRTIMFATTAFAKKDGLQEYPYCEPYRAVRRNGSLGESLQPSTHFRFAGKALIGWCDGHISEESPNDVSGENYYGGDNKSHHIGWFGPAEENGYWNPHSPAASQP